MTEQIRSWPRSPVGAGGYTGTMTCTYCDGTALAVVLLPGDDEPQATICLTCGRPQPVQHEQEA